MEKITPCLWFDTNAEEAAKYYVSVLKDAKILQTTYYSENMPLPAGTVLTVTFEANGMRFMALNGGPHFKFNEAISLMINCDTQAEIDYYWDRLIGDGGAEIECGWLRDKFGLCWQVVPSALPRLMEQNCDKVMQAVMKMKKLDIATLEKAAA